MILFVIILSRNVNFGNYFTKSCDHFRNYGNVFHNSDNDCNNSEIICFEFCEIGMQRHIEMKKQN